MGLALSGISRDDDYENIYGLNELRALFNDLAKNTFHFLALINACYGGDVFADGISVSTNDIAQRGAHAITAGTDDKVVYSSLNGQGSLFFQFLMEGIKSGDADHDAQQATLGVPGSVKEYEGIVRLGELDGYLFTAIKKYMAANLSISSDLEGNNHHWIGSVEPFGVRAMGGFFFFQDAPKSAITTFQTSRPTGTFVPSSLQVSTGGTNTVDGSQNDGLDRLRSKDGTPVRGIDVSHFNGRIDWVKVATAGIRFAYIKATQSSSLRDGAFGENWAASKEANVPHGAYHTYSFCVAPEEQFAALNSVVPADPSMLPIAIDAELFPGQENSNVGRQSAEANCVKSMGFGGVRASVQKFANLIQQKYGLRPILYGNDYVLDEVLTSEVISHFPLWRVRYGLASNSPHPPWAIWQYSINGKIAGVNNGVDINVIGGIPASNSAR